MSRRKTDAFVRLSQTWTIVYMDHLTATAMHEALALDGTVNESTAMPGDDVARQPP